MQKKDYVLLANAIKVYQLDICPSQWPEIMWEFVALILWPELKKQNERFDFYKFYEACGFPLDNKTKEV